MPTKVTNRNPCVKEITFGQIAVGEMFVYAGNLSRLQIKTDIQTSIGVEDGELSQAGVGVSCLAVDASVEWCVSKSI